MKELRVGFLGTGGIAEKHAASLAALPGVRIVGLCNRSLPRAEAFAAKLAPEARCFTDFGAMLGVAAMDVLYVCLPPGAHGGQEEEAAAQGIHLFLEKPIALGIERAESIAAAVRQSGVKCQVGHHMRHTGPAIKLKAMIEDGSAGRPLFMRGSFFCNALHPQWWRDPAMGGGQLVEQAIHVYDLARYFLGEAETAIGFAAKLAHDRFPDYRVDDASAATIRFSNGAIASISATNLAEPGKWACDASIQCELLAASFSSPDKASFILHGGMPAEELRKEKREPQREEVGSPVDCYVEISRNFLAAIRDGEALRSTVRDGVESLRLVLAVAESSRQGGAPQRIRASI
jgi:predicted dehydrogenase